VALDLHWMPAHAPYMPVATAGMLSVLGEAGFPATAGWTDGDPGLRLRVEAAVDVDDLASILVNAPWPSLANIRWPPGGHAQALKPTLARTGVPATSYRELVASAPPVEARLLRAILTDGALDDTGLPSRGRLLRGVKSDLSSVANRPKRIEVEALAKELREGPAFRKGESGLGLGLVPEVQTFGGSTGPDASSVGSYSPLLYLLLWHGLLALPPVPVARAGRRLAGGPLVTAPDILSWPRWRMQVGLRSLRTLFCLGAIHADRPDRSTLEARGIDAVFRARAVELSTMVAVFRWGEQVAA
jgi:hypothetical protein